MKVGIFTFHIAHNYGAMLQTYALKKTCESLGAETFVVDYKPAYIQKQYQYFCITKNFKTDMLNMFNLFGNIQKQRRFESFKNQNFNLIPFDTDAKFDVLLYGSDQIWNPNNCQGIDQIYFGKHSIDTKLNISYAASIGKSTLTTTELYELQKNAQYLDAISVREVTAKDMLQKGMNQEIKVVLDPTLLLDSKEWDKIAVKPALSHPYILVYEVNIVPKTMEIARALSDQTGLPIVEILYNKTKVRYGCKVYNNLGPKEFVGLFKNATYVVTNSFHGTAFSLIYKKNFYTIQHHAYGSRMTDLLHKLKLDDRLVSTAVQEIKPIDYEVPTKILKAEKEESLQFLQKYITQRESLK